MTTTTIIERLQPISLDALNDRAALQTRVDRKYALDRRDVDSVMSLLSHTTRVLEIEGARSASYESVYFDTPELLSYRMAAQGRRRRFKLRTRTYLDTRQVWLEVKTRGARKMAVKQRVEHEFAERGTLTGLAREYADEALESIGIDYPNELVLAPTLVTRYDRTTLFLEANGSRATIDTELCWKSCDGRTLRRPDLVIVETKSGVRNSELDRVLWSLGHRPNTVSKFGTGMAALRPDLPSNKWTRVLRQHFQGV
jgi:VTC domain